MSEESGGKTVRKFGSNPVPSIARATARKSTTSLLGKTKEQRWCLQVTTPASEEPAGKRVVKKYTSPHKLARQKALRRNKLQCYETRFL